MSVQNAVCLLERCEIKPDSPSLQQLISVLDREKGGVLTYAQIAYLIRVFGGATKFYDSKLSLEIPPELEDEIFLEVDDGLLEEIFKFIFTKDGVGFVSISRERLLTFDEGFSLYLAKFPQHRDKETFNFRSSVFLLYCFRKGKMFSPFFQYEFEKYAIEIATEYMAPQFEQLPEQEPSACDSNPPYPILAKCKGQSPNGQAKNEIRSEPAENPNQWKLEIEQQIRGRVPVQALINQFSNIKPADYSTLPPKKPIKYDCQPLFEQYYVKERPKAPIHSPELDVDEFKKLEEEIAEFYPKDLDIYSAECLNPFYEMDPESASIPDDSITSNTITTASQSSRLRHKRSTFLCYVRPLYSYTASYQDEHSLAPDSVMSVTQKGDDGWWYGVGADDSCGWFPSNYVAELVLSKIYENYSNHLIIGKEVFSCGDSDNWSFVYYPDSDWFGLVPTKILKPQHQKESPTSADNQTSANCDRRMEALNELLATENRYLQNLSLVIQFFYRPLCTKWEAVDTPRLFGNISQIYDFTLQFSNSLHSVENGLMAAKLFLEADFAPYAVYCLNQADAFVFLEKRSKEDAEFSEFLCNLKRQPELRGMQLGAFLLEPMQRITRYPLLLKQLLRYSQDSLEQEAVTKAIAKMELFLATLNSKIHDRDMDRQLQQLAFRILPTTTTAPFTFSLDRETKNLGKRKLFLGGSLEKIKGVYKQCQFFLLSDALLFCKGTDLLTLIMTPLPTAEIRILPDKQIKHSTSLVVDISYEPPSGESSSLKIFSLYFSSKTAKSSFLAEMEKLQEFIRVSEISNIGTTASISNAITSSKNCTLHVSSISLKASRTKGSLGSPTLKQPLCISVQPALDSTRRYSKAIFIGGDGKPNSFQSSAVSFRWNNSSATNNYELFVSVCRFEKFCEGESLAQITIPVPEIAQTSSERRTLHFKREIPLSDGNGPVCSIAFELEIL